jgi:gamma-glutamyltranspeptidase/glutathione hydrolase
MPRRTLLGLLATIAVLAAPAAAAAADPYQHTTQPVAQGTGGSAATVDSVATTAATNALRAGGNAVDAAVAAAAVLGVTEPFSSGIGGGGFMIIRTPDGKITTIDSREKSPAAMRPDSFWENGVPLPFAEARYSGLSVGVPGTVETWDEALEQYGTLSLAEALAPAIRVARDGFVVDETFAAQTQGNVDWFDDIPASAALYLDPDGTPRDVGSTFRNPDLARAYERIAKLGAKGFYRGVIAAALVETVQEPPVAGSTCSAWGRPRAAARPSARRSTSSRATTSRGWPGRRHSTTSSRPRATRSPTAARISATPTTWTCRSPACSPTGSPPLGAR